MSTTQHPPIGLLAGKAAVITGGGAGIGKAMAELFVREGAKVLVADITGAEREVASAIGANAIPFSVDVCDEAKIESMFAAALEAFGRVDASMHVAGNAGGRRGDEVTIDEFDLTTNVHLRGMMLSSKHAIRAMLKHGGGGAIVNVSSVASLNADSKISMAYSAAKAGINNMTKNYAVQYGPQGIRVNAIAPGFTLSEKNTAAPPEAIKYLSARAALQRHADPMEQAQVAAFLASDRASFVSGVVIPVDGGWSARLA